VYITNVIVKNNHMIPDLADVLFQFFISLPFGIFCLANILRHIMSLQLPSTTPINDLVKIIDNLPATTPKTNIKSISPILTQALQNSQTYSFSPLLTHPNVVAAKAAATTSSSSSESQSLLSALALVEIFESQSTVQFTSSTQSLPQLNTIMQR